MKILLKAHPSHIGPEVYLDLSDVVRIEMYGHRESAAGWVRARITVRTGGQVIEAKMAPEDYDQLVNDWMGEGNGSPDG